MDGISNYTCDCPEGFAGKYCELAPMVSMLMNPQASPCEASDCQNGMCLLGANDEHFCKCYPGFTGKYCEQASGVSFTDNDAYLQLSKFPLHSKLLYRYHVMLCYVMSVQVISVIMLSDAKLGICDVM